MTPDRDKLMTPLEAKVWTFLKERHKGVENATNRKTVLARFNLIHNASLDDREFRDVVANLVKVYKKAICTTPSMGYWVARTMRDKQPAIYYLDSLLTEVGDRRRALAEADPLDRQEKLF